MLRNTDPSVVKIEKFDLEERSVWVEGLRSGVSFVCLDDLCWSDSGFRIQVVDSYPIYASWRKEDSVYKDNTTGVFYIRGLARLDILHGNGGYEVLMSDTSVLKCEFEEYSGDMSVFQTENPATLKITPLKVNSKTTLTIQDREGQTRTYSIETGRDF